MEGHPLLPGQETKEKMREKEVLTERARGWVSLPKAFLGAGTAGRWVLTCCLSEREGLAEGSPRSWP